MPVVIIPAGLIIIAAIAWALIVGGGIIAIAIGAALVFAITALEKFYWSARRLKADLDPLTHEEILAYVQENLTPEAQRGLKLSIDQIKRLTAQYSLPPEYIEINAALGHARRNNYVGSSGFVISGVDIRKFGFTSAEDFTYTSSNPNAVIKWTRRMAPVLNHIRKNAPLCMAEINKNRTAINLEEQRKSYQAMAEEAESEQIAKQRRLDKLKRQLGK